jgi:hypothetical protein
MMNKGKTRVSLKAKEALWLRLKAAAQALADAPALDPLREAPREV